MNAKQREKPTGFSLCFLNFLLLLLLNPYFSLSQHNPDPLLAEILNGDFSQLPTFDYLPDTGHQQKKIKAITIFGHTLDAILSGTTEKCDNTLILANKILKDEKADAYTIIFAQTAKCIINGFKGEYISAVLAYYKAYNNLKTYNKHQYYRLPPEIHELKNIFNSIFNKIPATYHTTIKIAGIEPFTENKNSVNTTRAWKELANTMQVFRTTIIEKNPAKDINSNNAITHLMHGMLYIKNKQPETALNHLNSIDSVRNQIEIQYYLKGIAHMNIGEYQKASKYFAKFLLIREKGSFIKSTLLRQKWLATIHDKDTVKFTKAIQQYGTTFTYADKQAVRENKLRYNPKTLESRIRYDGGEYQKSLDILETINLNTLPVDDQLTFYYRKARNFQALEKYHDALSMYYEVLKLPNSGLYYHKKTALETGKIYLKIDNKNKAMEYLLKVPKIKSQLYSKIINQEAEYLLKNIH